MGVNGFLYAKSDYQWHCVKTTMKENIKTSAKLTFSGGASVAYLRLACSLERCWGLRAADVGHFTGHVQLNSDCTTSWGSTVMVKFFLENTRFFTNYAKQISMLSKRSMILPWDSQIYTDILSIQYAHLFTVNHKYCSIGTQICRVIFVIIMSLGWSPVVVFRAEILPFIPILCRPCCATFPDDSVRSLSHSLLVLPFLFLL